MPFTFLISQICFIYCFILRLFPGIPNYLPFILLCNQWTKSMGSSCLSQFPNLERSLLSQLEMSTRILCLHESYSILLSDLKSRCIDMLTFPSITVHAGRFNGSRHLVVNKQNGGETKRLYRNSPFNADLSNANSITRVKKMRTITHTENSFIHDQPNAMQ